jgi:kumamolisin
MANAKRGRPGRKPLGAIHNYLYQTLGVCSGITEGNNQRDGIGYYAHKGWNACTGLGVPNGARTITGLASKPV